MKKKAIWDQSREGAMIKEITDEVEKAVKEAESYKPVVENMFKYVYADMPLHLKEQMDELQGFISKKKGG
ncbi:MAG: hypothetical protein MPEBLZ_01896 [Candidatus Methanoperedens nitroreducens]|uniref:Uncharacterized protein n=1 Tax=Candidatus Methanoperedens nitratireducens TaxID=1392998 RepID=A0A0N8KQZ5_9EURY|nr:MAG: hypothetical protein MPEBLZ_01896 [Candidatus Methanoperedens sp. BLZ1]